jgi:predicted MFS family arabinose efflux permease
MRRITLAVRLSLFCDATLYLVLVPLIPYYADRFGLSKLDAGLVLAALPVTIMLTSVPLGILANRIGFRRAVIGGNAAFAVATVAFAFAPDVASLVIARSLQGLASAITWTATIAWLTANTPVAERGQAVGTAMGVVSFGAVAGPAIGALGGASSPALAFLVVAVIAVVAMAAAWRAPAGSADRVSAGGTIATLRRVGRHPLVIAAVAIGLIDTFSAAAINLLAPIGLDHAGYGSTAIGAAITVGSLLGLSLARTSGRLCDRVGAGRVAVLFGSATVGLMALLTLWPAPAMLLAALIAIGPLFAFLATAIYALAAAGADAMHEPHSAPNGILNLAWAGGLVVGQLGAGALGEHVSDRAAYGAATVLVAVLVRVIAVQRRRALALST